MSLFYYPDADPAQFKRCCLTLSIRNIDWQLLQYKAFAWSSAKLKVDCGLDHKINAHPFSGRTNVELMLQDLSSKPAALVVLHAHRLSQTQLKALKAFDVPVFLFGESRPDLLIGADVVRRPRPVSSGSLKQRFEMDGYVSGLTALHPTEAAKFLADLLGFESGLLQQQGGVWRLRQSRFETVNDPLFQWAKTLALHPKVLSPVRELIGEQILIRNVDVFTVLPDNNRTVDWHVDAAYPWPHTRGVLSAWINLTPVNAANGALSFLPGSHLHSFDKRTPDRLGLSDAELFELDFVHGIVNEMDAGGLSIHAGSTVHGSFFNSTKAKRVAFVVRYISGETTREHAECGKAYFAGTRPTEPFYESSTFPLHWHQPVPIAH